MERLKIDSKSGEALTKWYLRFNGYFIVDNFIVHAADDENRISKGIIGNYTETDLLAIRYRFSKEVSGPLDIQNDPEIINPKENPIDFIIVEVKTGNQNKPNKVWTKRNSLAIEYILRFAGFIETEKEISKIATQLLECGRFDEDNKFSIRFVLISEEEANKNWKHLTNILFDHIIDFLVDIRGQSWGYADIGISSLHSQWDDLIKDIFKIANDIKLENEDKKESIKELLQKA